jgi:sulfur dioxygenase
VFRQLFDAKSSTYTYLLADREAGEAVLIDPVFEQWRRDEALLRELGLTLRYTLDTHCHADHVTSAWLFNQSCGSEIAVAKESGVSGADVLLSHEDVIRYGDRQLSARATPGHTAGCMTFVGDGKAFTGDALLIRGAGRTDFQGGSAATLYRSVTTQILSLPDDTALFPAHDYAGRCSTTVWEEKKHNPRLGGELSENDFVGFMDNLGLAHPKQLDVALPANMQCGRSEAVVASLAAAPTWAPVVVSFAGIPELDSQWLSENTDGVRMIDVRSAEEFDGELGHIDGAELFPLDALADACKVWDRDACVVTVCRAGGRSAQAVRIMSKAGFSRVCNLRGGMIHWRDAGFPTVGD